MALRNFGVPGFSDFRFVRFAKLGNSEFITPHNAIRKEAKKCDKCRTIIAASNCKRVQKASSQHTLTQKVL